MSGEMEAVHDTEVVDPETGEVHSLARVDPSAINAALQHDAGTRMLARLSDAEFEARVALLALERRRVEQLFSRGVLREGIDYGTFDFGKAKRAEGDAKDDHSRRSLYQSGAEQVCRILGLVAVFPPELRVREYGDGVTGPAIRITTTCRLHLGTADGPCVGEGTGEANSWEVKYRYRSAKRACPKCGAEQINRSKFPPKGPDGRERTDIEPGWYCHAKFGGCGAQFAADDAAIVGQQVGRAENPDQHDQANTLLKQSAKRAHVDATKRTAGLSWLTSQDLEDLEGFEAAPSTAKPKAQAAPAPAGPPPIPEGSGSAHDKVILALGKKSTEAEVDAWHAEFKAVRAKVSHNAENSRFDVRVAWDVEERKRGIRKTAELAAKVKAEMEAAATQAIDSTDPGVAASAQGALDDLDDSDIPF